MDWLKGKSYKNRAFPNTYEGFLYLSRETYPIGIDWWLVQGVSSDAYGLLVEDDSSLKQGSLKVYSFW